MRAKYKHEQVCVCGHRYSEHRMLCTCLGIETNCHHAIDEWDTTCLHSQGNKYCLCTQFKPI